MQEPSAIFFVKIFEMEPIGALAPVETGAIIWGESTGSY
jgi:hypothetical protein